MSDNPILAYDGRDEINLEESVIRITESDKVIIDFVHVDEREHRVALPTTAALKLSRFIQDNIEDSTK